uniref:G protein-coupled receptor 158a n=1 Tax=Neolamprologus brichardi TaxID=32507 RepID=A0A3Q4MBX7_NEOBR
MAVFRLSLLLQVGFVIGSNLKYAEWSGHGEDNGAREAIHGAQTHRWQLAHLRAPHHAAGETAELPQKTDELLPRVVTAFLHTGDSTTLKHANCSRKYELTSLRGRSHATPHYSMSSVLDTVLHATNFLNMILQANRSREHNLRRDIEWYHALVRSILEGDAKIHRAVVTFSGDSSFPGPSVLLQATRAGGEIVLQDLSNMAHRHLHNRTAETEWYHEIKDRKNPNFHKRALSQDFRSVDNSMKRGESFIPDKTHVRWSAPYLECENGNFVPRWLLTLSAAFYGLKSNLAPEFGVVRVDINLQDVDIDQCSTDGWFAGTHRCNLTTMECLPIRGHGFVLDKYKCHCRKGFYHPNRVAVNGFTEESSSDCLPCQQGCAYCKDDTPCVVQEDGALRMVVVSFQCLCMLIVFISMVLIYHFRRNKSIRASGLVLLEAILCGALLLYFPFTLAPELHPDWMLLLFFTHTHLTVTVTLGLLLIPKFLFAGTHMRDDIASEAYEDELDMGRSGSYLNSSITSAWSEHSLDPEDIRTPDEMGHLNSINGCGIRSCDSLWEKRANEELKKLYSQLEIYKRKKMLANNPHLQKKRSSKKGLGRSLMRRITEIPESVHRQCSREEKEVGEHGSNRNSISMLKKPPLDTTHPAKPAKEETLKNKVFSLKKSHSSYDHVRDQNEDSSSTVNDKIDENTAEGSLLDTLMGKKLVKKTSSENINAPSESTESVPLVCKSASAHNLSADKKPIHPRASMLQKSLSVIASAKEKTLGLTGKTQGTEESNKKSQPKSKDTKANVEPENECQPKMIISQSVEYKQSTTKGIIMKQPVSGSQPTICADPIKGKDLYDLSEVCPWEVEDLPTPSENKVQKHVSIAPKETTTVHGGSTKGAKSQKQKGSDHSPSSGRHPKEIQRSSAIRADVCPWEDRGESQASQAEASKQSVSQSKAQQPPSSVESSRTHRADVCPWDFEELKKPTESAHSPDVTKQKKGTSPIDVRDPPKGSLQPLTSKVDVCPWEFDNSAAAPERIPSPSQAPKTKESPSKKKGPPFTRTVDQEKSKDTDDEKSRTKVKDKSKSSEKHVGQQKMAEVCPWDVESHQEMLLVEKRKSANVGAAKEKQTEVCPWDFEEKTGTDKSASAVKQSKPTPKGGPVGAAKKADVCPWDFEDSTSSKKA